MTPNETFVVLDWMINTKRVQDNVVFVGNEADAKAFQAQRDVEAGYTNSVEVTTFDQFLFEVRTEAECS